MKSVKLAIVTVAVLAAVPALAQLKLDANLEYTYGYKSVASAGTTKATSETSQAGRVEVIALSRREVGDAFFESKGVIRLKNDGTTAIQDIYGQFGRNNAWNLKFGRFEATDLFPTGKDQALLDLTDANILRGNGLRGRSSSPSHFALTVMASPSVSIELGTQFGTKTVNEATSATVATVVSRKSETTGLRPIVSVKAGTATVKLGLESSTTKVSIDGGATEVDTALSAFAVTVAIPAGSGNMNINLSNSTLDNKLSTVKAETTAMGVNGTWGGFGAGVIINDLKATQTGFPDGKITSTSLYAAYSMPLLAVPSATFTLGAGLQTLSGDLGANDPKTGNLLNARFNYSF